MVSPAFSLRYNASAPPDAPKEDFLQEQEECPICYEVPANGRILRHYRKLPSGEVASHAVACYALHQNCCWKDLVTSARTSFPPHPKCPQCRDNLSKTPVLLPPNSAPPKKIPLKARTSSVQLSFLSRHRRTLEIVALIVANLAFSLLVGGLGFAFLHIPISAGMLLGIVSTFTILYFAEKITLLQSKYWIHQLDQSEAKHKALKWTKVASYAQALYFAYLPSIAPPVYTIQIMTLSSPHIVTSLLAVYLITLPTLQFFICSDREKEWQRLQERVQGATNAREQREILTNYLDTTF